MGYQPTNEHNLELQLQLGKIGNTRYKTTWILDRITETRIKVLNRNFTIVGVYAPVEGKEQDTEEFYRELQQSIDKIPKKQICTAN